MAFRVDWTTANIQHLEGAIERIEGKHENALEIGCYEGRTTLKLLEHFLHVDVIDTFEGSKEIENYDAALCKDILKNFTENIGEQADRVGVYKGPSTKWLSQFIVSGRQYDFIYVDGNHTAFQAAIDGLLSIELIRPGGVVIFDDYLTFIHNSTNPTHAPTSHEAIDFILNAAHPIIEIIGVGHQVSLRCKKLSEVK